VAGIPRSLAIGAANAKNNLSTTLEHSLYSINTTNVGDRKEDNQCRLVSAKMREAVWEEACNEHFPSRLQASFLSASDSGRLE
jgi:hypothetical protein